MRSFVEPEPDIRGAVRKAWKVQILFLLVFVGGAALTVTLNTIVPLFIGVGFNLGLMVWMKRQPWYVLLKRMGG